MRNLLLLAGLAATFAWMLHTSWLKWPDLLIDSGEELYVPWQITEGATLYRDIVSIRGPLAPFLHALLFAAFGPSLLNVALFNIALIVGFSVLLFRVFSRISGPYAGALSCFVFLTVFAFGQYEFIGNANFVTPYSHEQTHCCILGALIVFAVERFLTTGRGRWLPLAGASCGLAFLGKPESFLICLGTLACGIGAAVLLRPSWRRRCARMAIPTIAALLLPGVLAFGLLQAAYGGTVGMHGLFAGWIALLQHRHEILDEPLTHAFMGTDNLAGNLREMLSQFGGAAALVLGMLVLNHSLRRVRPWVVSIPFAVATAAVLIAVNEPIWWMERLRSLPLVLIGYGAVQLLDLWRNRLDEDALCKAIPRFLLTAFGLVMTFRMVFRVHVPAYGFTLALFATLVAVDLLVFRLGCAAARISGARAAYSIAALSIVAMFVASHVQESRRILSCKEHLVGGAFKSFDAKYDGGRAAQVNALLRWLAASTREDSTMVVLPEGVMLNFLARRRNPTPFLTYNPVLFRVQGDEEVARRFAESRPDYVFLVHRDNTEHGARFFGVDYGRALQEVIDAQYEQVALLGKPPFRDEGFGIRILTRRDGRERP